MAAKRLGSTGSLQLQAFLTAGNSLPMQRSATSAHMHITALQTRKLQAPVKKGQSGLGTAAQQLRAVKPSSSKEHLQDGIQSAEAAKQHMYRTYPIGVFGKVNDVSRESRQSSPVKPRNAVD